MLEMIKKHTVPETGNWRSICPMVDRTYDMLRMAKDATRNFVRISSFNPHGRNADVCESISNLTQVPPANQREQVPLGASSASMYPGYSPADHEYGKAAFEYGKAVADARRQGTDFDPSKDPDGPEYVIGQAKGEKRKSFTRMKAEQTGAGGVGSGDGFGSGSDTQNAKEAPQETAKDSEGHGAGKSAQPVNGDNPFFIIDTNPTPVNVEGLSHGQHKRTSAEAVEEKKSKKLKTKHAESDEGTKVQLEDITEEVDARLREKEEKRKRKEEKKRKRESEGSGVGVVEASNGVVPSDKPKKKKNKSEEALGDVAGDEEIDKKKKRRKSEGEEGAVDEGEKKKKRRMTIAD